MTPLVDKASKYAIRCHSDTSHQYDGRPYSYHLASVYSFGVKYQNLLPEHLREAALAACWTHDVIEDCRQVYSDVKKACGEEVAELTYALTNEKGKNRKERSNDKYYDGILKFEAAIFVKVCDVLANATHSKETSSSMINVYRKEQPFFFSKLGQDGKFKEMFEELDALLSE